MPNDQVEKRLADQFERLLSLSEDTGPEDLHAELTLARQLEMLDLSLESRVKIDLRSQLQHNAHHLTHVNTIRRRTRVRSGVFASAMLMLLAFLMLSSNIPNRAAIQRLLGYAYLPQAGFIHLSDTRLITGPVTQSDYGHAVTVLQGIQDADKTFLWIWTNLNASELFGAEIVLPDQTRLPLQSILPGGDYSRLTFGPLPSQVQQIELVLPGGWQLPLTWIPARQASLAATQVSVPFLYNTPSWISDRDPCVELGDEVQLCVEAAYIDLEGTHIILQGFQSGEIVRLSQGASSAWRSITLKGSQGRSYSIVQSDSAQETNTSVLSLRFAGLPTGVDAVTLNIPAQAIKFGDRVLSSSRIIAIPVKLPERTPFRSPTPGVMETAFNDPVVAPTPMSMSQP